MWNAIGSALKKVGLPLLGAVVPGAGVVQDLVMNAVGSNDQDEILKKIEDPAILERLRKMELGNQHELRTLQLQAEVASIRETAQTARIEAQSEDAFVRRARPSLIYILGFSVFFQVILAGLVILVAPDHIADLGALYTALATPQSVALAACGVYMHSRGREKLHRAGGGGPGLLQALVRSR